MKLAYKLNHTNTKYLTNKNMKTKYKKYKNKNIKNFYYSVNVN